MLIKKIINFIKLSWMFKPTGDYKKVWNENNSALYYGTSATTLCSNCQEKLGSSIKKPTDI